MHDVTANRVRDAGDAGHGVGELVEGQRLLAIGHRGRRIGMHLDDEPIGARGNRGQRQRRDETGACT